MINSVLKDDRAGSLEEYIHATTSTCCYTYAVHDLRYAAGMRTTRVTRTLIS